MSTFLAVTGASDSLAGWLKVVELFFLFLSFPALLVSWDHRMDL